MLCHWYMFCSAVSEGALNRKGVSVEWEPIKKFPQTWTVRPNLLDYDQTRATFSWDTVRRELDGLPDGKG
jgi:hypothetical protein